MSLATSIPCIMEVEKLKRDELLFEISVRGEVPDSTAKVDDLRTTLKKLMAVEHEVDLEDVYEGTDDEELLIIDLKLTEVEGLLEELRDADKGLRPSKAKTALSHLNHRVTRLFARVRATKKRNVLKELANRLKSGIDTLKQMGEGAAYNASVFGSFSSAKDETVSNKQSRHSDESTSGEESSGGKKEKREKRKDKKYSSSSNSKFDFHKWGLKYSGSEEVSVNSFIVDAEEKAISKGMKIENLLLGATEFFTGVAKTWYRSVRDEINSWSELKVALRAEFLPLDYADSLWEEIRNRKQGPREALGVFVANMAGLFSRLEEVVSEERKLKIIMDNLAPFYMEKLALQPVLSLRKLKELGKVLDASKAKMDLYNTPRSKPKALEPEFGCKGPKVVVHEVAEQSAEKTPTSSSRVHSNTKPPPAPNPNRRKVGCWQCSSPDHGWRFCPAPKKWDFCAKCGYKGTVGTACPRCAARRVKDGEKQGE